MNASGYDSTWLGVYKSIRNCGIDPVTAEAIADNVYVFLKLEEKK